VAEVAVDEERIRTLVREVVERLAREGVLEGVPPAPPSEARGRLGVYPTVDEAVRRAAEAQKRLMEMTLEDRRRIVENIRRYAKENARRLAQMAYEETKMGRFEDKIRKNEVAADMSPGVEDLVPEVFRDHQGITIQDGFPYGVICAICPITNPTATVINNSIIMVAAGNAVVFCPHPGAKECTLEAIHICNQAIIDAGGPPDLLTSVAEPSIQTAQETMRHELVSLIVATGGPAVVRVAMGMRKEVIAAGPGNPVVLVDETADIPKAAADIVAGAFFDNNLLCVGEKVVFPVEEIADRLIREMQKEGAFLVEPVDVPKLERVCFPEGRLNRELVGKDGVIAVVTDHGHVANIFVPPLQGWLEEAGLLRRNPDGSINWAETKAFATHIGVWVNLKGRDPQGIVEPGEEYEQVREEVIRAALQVREPHTGEPAFQLVARREDLEFMGIGGERFPDVILALRPFPSRSRFRERNMSGWLEPACGTSRLGLTGIISPRPSSRWERYRRSLPHQGRDLKEATGGGGQPAWRRWRPRFASWPNSPLQRTPSSGR